MSARGRARVMAFAQSRRPSGAHPRAAQLHQQETNPCTAAMHTVGVLLCATK